MSFIFMERVDDRLKEKLHDLHIDRSPPSAQRAGGLQRWLVITVVFVIGITTGMVIIPRIPLKSIFGSEGAKVQVATSAFKSKSGSEPFLIAGGYIIARHQVEVGSKITGRVIALEVKEGTFVRRDQIIARLENYELSAQLRQAEAHLEAAKAHLSELEAGSRPQEIERMKAEALSARAGLTHAELNLKRIERLVTEGIIDQKTLEDARARYDTASATLRAAEESHDLARIGPRHEAIAVARAQASQAMAEVAIAKAQLDNAVIRAPIAGTILDCHVDPGEMVTTGFTSNRGAKQAIVTMADLKDLLVELEISESDIAKVNLGQPNTIAPDAYPGHSYKGAVEYIASAADRQKATIKVKVAITDADEHLRPDMGAKVAFYREASSLSEQHNTVIVPKSAMVQQGNSYVVFLARDSKVAIQAVSPGKEEGGYVEILSGLQGGETVIISNQTSLKDGDEISIQQ
jgi:HlyD family secretion protein